MLKHRWPTALGITVAAQTAYDIDLHHGILVFLSLLIAVMALVYLGAAALDRRRSARPRWQRSTWIWISADTSWRLASSATLPGTPSTICETG